MESFVSSEDERLALAAYDLGRTGVAAGLSGLAFVEGHHQTLDELLLEGRLDQRSLTLARSFLMEALMPFFMVRGMP